MMIVISPAKSLDFEKAAPVENATLPDFMKYTRALIKQLRKLDSPEIKKLMGVSDKIAELNFQRFQKFRSPHKPENAKPDRLFIHVFIHECQWSIKGLF